LGSGVSIAVAYHRPEIRDQALASLGQYDIPPVFSVDGGSLTSCSQLWNTCIDRCETDTLIICNEKARPTKHHIEKVQQLLDEGFGLVGLYRFGFFGFRKDTIRKIGFFDERYVGGHYEDNDTILRLKEADIAYYETEETPYIQMSSAWHHEQAKSHWKSKWRLTKGFYQRLQEEENYSYKLGEPAPQTLLPWSRSKLLTMSGGHLNRQLIKHPPTNRRNYGCNFIRDNSSSRE